MKKLTFYEKIYTYHIDFAGHVNNIIYVQWMENGRVKLLEAVEMPPNEMAQTEAIFPILTETSIQYKKPLFLKNTVTIECWVSKINNASVILEFRFYNEENELCATGWQKGSFINRDNLKPVRLTEKHRQAFEKYLIAN